MRIVIDATNIGIGGGITHLREIISNFNSENEGISKIIIVGSQKTIDQVANNPILEKMTFPELNRGLISRLKFQIFQYDGILKVHGDILFSLTGDYFGDFRPVVAMSRNMLLYERNEWWEIGQLREILRFYVNYLKQKKSFRNASGIIFISEYAQKIISTKLKLMKDQSVIVNHGVSKKFSQHPTKQFHISNYSESSPFKLLYPSTIHTYKNQLNVVKCVSKLRSLGYPIQLTLVGAIIYKPEGERLINTISKLDPLGNFISYKGNIPYNEMEIEYLNCNGIIFASTCENMPNILMESMASGKAIACSDKQPMPEFLKKNGFYFNAKDLNSIAESLIEFLENPEKRQEYIQNNKNEIDNFSWERTSRDTFSYIINVYQKFKYVQK